MTIQIDNLRMRFGRMTAVDDVSIHVQPGESVALWGANGAGKTTIIRCVLGLLRYEGSVRIAGRDALRQGKEARQLIGYVPQELGFYDDLRTGEALHFFGGLKGVRVEEAERVLERVGLPGQSRKRIRELSGGMKQRLALAIALLGDPPVLVLDEVTASLDACGREEFVGLLQSLAKGGRSMLFASHRSDEVQALADRVIVLEKGRIKSESPAMGFRADSGDSHVLHLIMKRESVCGAIATLRGHGYLPTLNGVGLFVPARGERKVEALRVLEAARIRVEDFEVVSAKAAAREERES